MGVLGGGGFGGGVVNDDRGKGNPDTRGAWHGKETRVLPPAPPHKTSSGRGGYGMENRLKEGRENSHTHKTSSGRGA